MADLPAFISFTVDEIDDIRMAENCVDDLLDIDAHVNNTYIIVTQQDLLEMKTMIREIKLNPSSIYKNFNLPLYAMPEPTILAPTADETPPSGRTSAKSNPSALDIGYCQECQCPYEISVSNQELEVDMQNDKEVTKISTHYLEMKAV